MYRTTQSVFHQVYTGNEPFARMSGVCCLSGVQQVSDEHTPACLIPYCHSVVHQVSDELMPACLVSTKCPMILTCDTCVGAFNGPSKTILKTTGDLLPLALALRYLSLHAALLLRPVLSCLLYSFLKWPAVLGNLCHLGHYSNHHLF